MTKDQKVELLQSLQKGNSKEILQQLVKKQVEDRITFAIGMCSYSTLFFLRYGRMSEQDAEGNIEIFNGFVEALQTLRTKESLAAYVSDFWRLNAERFEKLLEENKYNPTRFNGRKTTLTENKN